MRIFTFDFFILGESIFYNSIGVLVCLVRLIRALSVDIIESHYSGFLIMMLNRNLIIFFWEIEASGCHSLFRIDYCWLLETTVHVWCEGFPNRTRLHAKKRTSYLHLFLFFSKNFIFFAKFNLNPTSFSNDMQFIEIFVSLLSNNNEIILLDFLNDSSWPWV